MSIDLAQSILLHLRKTGDEAVRDKDLAEELGSTPTAVGDAMAFLHDAGLIETEVLTRFVRIKGGA